MMYNIERLYSVHWENNKCIRILGLGNRKREVYFGDRNRQMFNPLS